MKKKKSKQRICRECGKKRVLDKSRNCSMCAEEKKQYKRMFDNSLPVGLRFMRTIKSEMQFFGAY